MKPPETKLETSILFISPVGCIGGAERVLLDCVQQVRRLRPQWIVTAILFADGPLRASLVALGAEVMVVALPKAMAESGDSQSIGTAQSKTSGIRRALVQIKSLPAYASFLFSLARTVARVRPDILHSNGIKSHLCTALAAGFRQRIIWHVHDYYSQRPTIKRLMQVASRRVERLLVISRSVQQDARIVMPTARVEVLMNCVDAEHFCPGEGDPQELDRIAGLEHNRDDFRIGLVATYSNWKGHDVFLEALAACPGVRGYIVGGPIYTTGGSQWSRDELVTKAEQLGVSQRIGFVPFQADPTWVYRSLNVVVHASSRPEPFGLSIVEAMACGRPVIVSAAGGACELFTAGVDALGFEPGNVGQLVSHILKLRDEAVTCETLGQNARKSAIKSFSKAAFGACLIGNYEQTPSI